MDVSLSEEDIQKFAALLVQRDRLREQGIGISCFIFPEEFYPGVTTAVDLPVLRHERAKQPLLAIMGAKIE